LNSNLDTKPINLLLIKMVITVTHRMLPILTKS